MHETIEKIFKYTSDLKTAEDFEKDTESFDAVIMNFIVLGESVSKLTQPFKDQNTEISIGEKFTPFAMFWHTIISVFYPKKFGKSSKNIYPNSKPI
jgi:hypothetical protein